MQASLNLSEAHLLSPISKTTIHFLHINQGGIVGKLDDDGNIPVYEEALGDGECRDANDRSYESVQFTTSGQGDMNFLPIKDTEDAKTKVNEGVVRLVWSPH